MKTAILTDLHANRQAVEAVLEHAAEQGAQAYALLGDFVGYGADPGWVVDQVRALCERGAVAVMGNHDLATVRGPSEGMRPEPRQVIEWTRAQLDADQLGFLSALPMLDETPQRLYVHANAWAPRDWGYIQSRLDAVRSLHSTRSWLTFCGHMHEQRLYHLSSVGKVADFTPVSGTAIPLLPQRRWLALPGSVGQPRDGNPAAAYAMMDEAAAALTFWRVPYDHETAAARIRAAGLPPALAERLFDGL
ncbi:MAG: metallophosphoesterase family protein [Rubrivivax sp.]